LDAREFAEGLISSKFVIPKSPSEAALFAWQSIDELRTQPFNPLFIDRYLSTVEIGKKLVIEKREKERKVIQEAIQRRVEVYKAEIWKSLKSVFVWHYERLDKLVELDATIEFEPAFLSGPTVTSSGTKIMEHSCRLKQSGKIEIDLKPMLDPWIGETAAQLVRENRPLPVKQIPLLKTMLLTNSNLEIRCPLANPLIDPRLSCSVFASGSDRVLGCSTFRLVLKEK